MEEKEQITIDFLFENGEFMMVKVNVNNKESDDLIEAIYHSFMDDESYSLCLPTDTGAFFVRLSDVASVKMSR